MLQVCNPTGRSIWKAETTNAEGRLLQVKKGAKTTTYNYDNMGLPETIQCGGIINHHRFSCKYTTPNQVVEEGTKFIFKLFNH